MIIINFVTLKAAAKHKLLFRGGFIEHLSRTYVVKQSVIKYIVMNVINLVTLKAVAEHELCSTNSLRPCSDSDFLLRLGWNNLTLTTTLAYYTNV
jgi:hypothetical protein